MKRGKFMKRLITNTVNKGSWRRWKKNKWEIIIKNFRKRDCFTLIMPEDEDKFKNLENVPISSLKPNFIKQVKI